MSNNNLSISIQQQLTGFRSGLKTLDKDVTKSKRSLEAAYRTSKDNYIDWIRLMDKRLDLLRGLDAVPQITCKEKFNHLLLALIDDKVANKPDHERQKALIVTREQQLLDILVTMNAQQQYANEIRDFVKRVRRGMNRHHHKLHLIWQALDPYLVSETESSSVEGKEKEKEKESTLLPGSSTISLNHFLQPTTKTASTLMVLTIAGMV